MATRASARPPLASRSPRTNWDITCCSITRGRRITATNHWDRSVSVQPLGRSARLRGQLLEHGPRPRPPGLRRTRAGSGGCRTRATWSRWRAAAVGRFARTRSRPTG
ncbi:MAG: hypothetical protein MZV70_19720 [Desulfobacterales bacterium]|nr:hypothetical protein [Desulfobacterales bacterium]